MANNSLRSFASGMIIATSIFTAIYYFQPSIEDEKKIVEEHIITDEEVQQYLNNKGYISIPKQTYDQLIAKESKEKKTENKVKIEQEQKDYTLTVISGMDSMQIGNLLEKAGIIESRDAFEQYLVKKNWHRSIQIGNYELNSSMSYQEIGKIITKK